MFSFLGVVSVFLFVFSCQANKLPTYFKQCKRTDPEVNKCIIDAANRGYSTFVHGDKDYRIPSLQPLHVPAMYMDVGGNLKVNITDADITGMEGLTVGRLNWDFDKKEVNALLLVPEVHLVGTYDIAGRILILPINGHGPCNITYIGGGFKMWAKYELEERRNKEYMKIVDKKLTYDVTRAYFQLDNLFNGDKRLGIEMSKFLNENWKEVDQEIGARVGDALAEIFANIMQGFFYKVPFNNLFA